ncbi:MAG TPA: undecaprenyl-diphosphate phosphatase [Gaiellaceae bacterium]|nr:undecaprenyl-diphosphate phosphatase [Gaiellaceae bacterium]
MLGAGAILFLAALQGATELFPVSSLGHAVVVPALFHLGFKQSDPDLVPILTLLHLGTAGALLVLYRDEWWRIIRGFVRAAIRGTIETSDERLAMMLVVGTIPTGVVGFFFVKQLSSLFGDPRASSAFLIVNAGILAGAEVFRRRDERRRRETRAPAGYAGVDGLTLRTAVIVGACQMAALFPGISRSGVTMAAGLVAGLRHEEAARFAFLLATPIILSAGLLEVPSLNGSGSTLAIGAGGAVLAGVVSYLSARFLLRYLRFGRLDPFAYYCAALGTAGLVFIR